VGGPVSSKLLALDLPFIDTGIDTPPEAAITVLIAVYALAAWFNTRIPHTGVAMRPLRSDPNRSFVGNLIALLPDFWQCNARLWRDKLGQISLATTTLFWGAGGNLKYIVLAWASLALGYSTPQASALTGVVAIGTAVGAVVASVRMRLDMATQVIPLGIGMGLLVIAMNFISNVWVAIPFLILLGGLGGFLVVPMNALLQHRGHNLMGAGRSIAVQNFNEQACILLLGAFYSACTGLGLSAFGAITAFGIVVAGFMEIIRRWHQRNLKVHGEEVQRLLEIARSDKHH
jgi:LPLT family lysophospholipid transporter-like MFS transporter